MGGDTIRVAGAAKAYNGAQKGVSFYLDMVKLIAKNNAGGNGPGNAASVFGEDEGFTADDEPAALEAEVPSGSPIDIDDL
jgi:hypothetical protein